MFFTKGNAFHVFSQWKVGIETKKRSISKEFYITRCDREFNEINEYKYHCE